ncbi:MAG TPA: TldD/PmbA family protein [bacterium]|nr:TldD/PmbA family protein [bacterium]
MADNQAVWRINRREFLQGLTAAGIVAGVAPGAIATAHAGADGFGGLPIDETLIAKLLQAAMAKGGEFAEVYVQDSIGTNVSLDEKKIRSATVGVSRGVGIRVIKGLKIGYAYSDDFSAEALLATAKTAALIAGGDGSWQPQPLKPHMAKSISPIEVSPADVPVEKKVAMLLAADEKARSLDPRVLQVMGRFADVGVYRLIANTDGLLIEDRDVLSRLSISVIAADGNDRHAGFFGGGGRVGFEHYRTFTPELIAERAARMAVDILGATSAPTGEQTVVLGNGWAGILLHEAVGHGLEADFIRKKTSLYTDRVGQQVASEHVTVIDDATLPNERGSFNVDDEGELPQRKVLIENGILRGYLFDKLNAKLMGGDWKSTGSGRRESFRHFPMPRMSNTFLGPGKATKDEVIGSVKQGFYAKMFGGGQVDISNGNFVFEVAEGYLIEDGKVTKPVKDAMLIGVGPDALTKVTMVGNDDELDPGIGTCGKNGQSVPVGVGLGHVRIEKMTVGGTKG